MSNNNRRNGAPSFDMWEPILEAAISTAERYDERYRATILQALLRSVGAEQVVRPIGSPRPGGSDIGVEPEDGLDPVRRAAERASVDPEALARIVHVGDDGSLRILEDVGGRSKAETANRAAAAYLYIKEHGFGERDVEIGEIRQVVIDQGAYDSPNFTRNLRTCPWLLEIGRKGSHKKKYRLSTPGQETAGGILRDILEG